MITVVKMNAARTNFTRYIGRKFRDMQESCFQNPFHVGKDGDRQEVLLKFLVYWYAPEQKWLRDHALIFFQANEILGCWCKPLECHGDIEAGYVNWRRGVGQEEVVYSRGYKGLFND